MFEKPEKAFTIGESLKNLISTTKQKRWIRRRAQLKYNIEHWAEREAYIYEKLQSLKELKSAGYGLTFAQKINMVDYKNRLNNLKRELRITTRNLHQHLQKTPEGPYIQRYNLEQKENHELITLWAKDRCKYEGGCCAFGCGCCSKPRDTFRDHELIDPVFHCTGNCRCCVRRGHPAKENPRRIQVITV